MNGKIKTFIIALLSLLAIACLSACEYTPMQKDPYTAYEINRVNIVQQTSTNYSYVVESDITPSETAKVYITRYDSIPEDATAIPYTAKSGKYVFDAEVKYDSYFIFVVDGDKTAVLPMTRPQMAPTLTANEESNVLSYNFVNGTSWSSFCDPTGKAVFKSASPVFDDNAEIVAQNVNIFGIDTTTDTNASEEKPYYYVVLSAKNGIVTYVSAPIMTLDKTYSDIEVSIGMQESKPVLSVSGKFVTAGNVAVELYSADTKLGKVMEIVGDTVTGDAGDEFTATLDIDQVISGKQGAGIWYDIKLLNASGSLYELPKDVANMNETLNYGGVTFDFKEWNNILKLNYTYYTFEVTSVEIDTEGVPTIVVKGLLPTDIADVKVHADGNSTHYYWDNVSTESGKFEIRVNLDKLNVDGTPWCWFHIYTYETEQEDPSKGYDSTDLMLAKTPFEANDSWSYKGISYTVQGDGTYGLLVIQPKELPAYEITSMSMNAETATMTVKGNIGTYADIKIHADGNNNHYYWNSTVNEKGEFEITVNLDKIPVDGTPWAFFHIYTYAEKQTDPSQGFTKVDIMLEATPFNEGDSWDYNGIRYTVQGGSATWGLLVIQPKKIETQKAYTVTVDATNGTLTFEGAMPEGVSDVKLHAWAEKDLTWDNVSTEEGKFKVVVKLSDIPVEGTPWAWFHVYAYATKGGDYQSTDLARSTTGLNVGDGWDYNGIRYTVQDKDQLVIQPKKIETQKAYTVTLDTSKATVTFKGNIPEGIKEIKIHTSANGREAYWNNTSTEEGKFEITVDLTQITADDTPWIWFHVYTYANEVTDPAEGFTKTDIPLDETGLTKGSYFDYNGIRYTVVDNSGTYDLLVVQPTEAPKFAVTSMTMDAATATMTIKGTLGDYADIKIHADGNNKHYYWDNVSTESGKFEINVNLGIIPVESSTPWCWFHIYTYNEKQTDPSQGFDKIDLQRTATGLEAGVYVDYNGIRYTVQNNSQFVIQATVAPKFAVTSMTMDPATATMTIKGTLGDYADIKVHANTDKADNSGHNDYYWDNVSTESGKFEINVNLDKIPVESHTPWAWFHIYTYNEKQTDPSQGFEKINLQRSATGLEAGAYVDYNEVRYTVQNQDQFVIQAKAIEIGVGELADNFSDLKVELCLEDGKPILKVTGKFVRDGDITVVIYSNDNRLSSEMNLKGQKVSGKKGESFTATVDLTDLVVENGSGIWFDVKLVTEAGGNFDTPASTANMEQTITCGTVTFSYAAWENALKVKY